MKAIHFPCGEPVVVSVSECAAPSTPAFTNGCSLQTAGDVWYKVEVPQAVSNDLTIFLEGPAGAYLALYQEGDGYNPVAWDCTVSPWGRYAVYLDRTATYPYRYYIRVGANDATGRVLTVVCHDKL